LTKWSGLKITRADGVLTACFPMATTKDNGIYDLRVDDSVISDGDVVVQVTAPGDKRFV